MVVGIRENVPDKNKLSQSVFGDFLDQSQQMAETDEDLSHCSPLTEKVPPILELSYLEGMVTFNPAH